MDARVSQPVAGPVMGQVPSQGAGPLTHRLLEGRYEVGRLLARGGMATVYEAIDTRLGRTVAIKVMHPAFAADAEFVARFIREARSAARISHANVVAVYDQGTDGDAVFLAMEYVPGGTLRDLLRHRGRLTPAEALPLYEQMLAALASAHKAGLVHRDIKPENMLITDDGRVKVADFGLARAISSSVTNAATSGIIIGTVSYLSPEQVERSVADARSDVYSAGIVLYEMLTGEKPYKGETPMEVAFQHVHSRVPAPSALVPGLPADLDTIVARATARDPDLRPHDAGELLAEVVRARQGRPLLLPPLPGDNEPTVRRDDVRDGDTAIVGTAPLPLPLRPPASTPGRQPVPAGATRAPAPTPPTHGWSPGPRSYERPPYEPSQPVQVFPPEIRRHRRRGWIIFLVVLLLGISAAVGGYWFAEGRFTETPAVVGMAQQDALLAIERRGLEPSIAPDAEPSETIAVSHVVRTEPGPNARILSGAEVLLVLSAGPERFTIPDVSGSTPDRAVDELQSDQLPLDVAAVHKEEYSETVPAGAVVRTEPASGEKVKRGQAVTLVLSLGRELLPVPDVRTTTLEEATATLTDAGFEVTSEEVFDPDIDAGLVVGQDKTGELYRNDTIHLTVSKGPELFSVPGVLGEDTDDAVAILEDAGFTVNVIRVLPAPLTDNIVLRQTPGSGDYPAGTEITIYVI